MRSMANIALSICLIFVCGYGLAAEVVSARCIGVLDGDTITVLTSGNQQIRVRLAGIDAPEKAMPWGQRAKQALSGMVFGRDVQVRIQGKDRYGRTIGTILFAGEDVNLEMLHQGMAWHYKQYAKDQLGNDATRYAAVEREARSRRAGLWADDSPTPPWEWRKEKKKEE